MIIDSGSDILWIQCQPFEKCYRQSNKIFNPVDSASYTDVSCGSSVCDFIQISGCHAGRCLYELMYSNGSYTKGNLTLETLTFNRIVIKNMVIGCGHINRGRFVAAAELLGIKNGSMSLLSQLGCQICGVFSYCLVSRSIGSSGSLVFGRGAMPLSASWVPLLCSLRFSSFY